MAGRLTAGAASEPITPTDTQFLYGYPHVERYSTGVHDPLLSTALYLSDGETEAMFIANDIIFIPKTTARSIRERIEKSTAIPASNVMVTATHTHSGPITVDYASCKGDPIVPTADPSYVRFMADAIVDAAVKAYRAAEPAEVGLAVADGTSVGTNRRDPSGPADPEVPVLLVRRAAGGRAIAVMVVCSMHPTVLHEDSTLVSADFPGMTRRHIQRDLLWPDCPVLHHTGPAGDQSPRHVTSGNTFDEAERLGAALAEAVGQALGRIEFIGDVAVGCRRELVDLPRRSFPSVEQAIRKERTARDLLAHLRDSGAPRQQTRTAECDWFGAEETLTMAKAASDGSLSAWGEACLPAEVQVITIGPWAFAGWQGEVFVEYALAVKARRADTFVISLANGELQGYIVTPAAAAEGGYEASNALFSPETGNILVDATLRILSEGGT